MGVDPSALRKTIDTYNAGVDAGIDSEFGRTEYLQKFEDDTFYAAYTLPYVMLTSGGVVIDENAQILNTEGAPIPGLYACGEMVGMGNIGGHTSIGGIGHGLCATFGTRAAVTAVENALR